MRGFDRLEGRRIGRRPWRPRRSSLGDSGQGAGGVGVAASVRDASPLIARSAATGARVQWAVGRPAAAALRDSPWRPAPSPWSRAPTIVVWVGALLSPAGDRVEHPEGDRGARAEGIRAARSEARRGPRRRPDARMSHDPRTRCRRGSDEGPPPPGRTRRHPTPPAPCPESPSELLHGRHSSAPDPSPLDVP